MKNSKLYLVIILALAIGFLLAWTIKPNGQMAVDNEAVTAPAQEEIWTCSMHPQIRQNEPGECPICGMDLIPLAAATGTDPLVLEMTPEAVKLADIQTTTIGMAGAGAAKTIRLSGKVQADERLAATQVAQVPGRIEKLYVTFTGEAVRKGQKLADIYSPDLVTAQRELLEAKKLQDLNPALLEAARNKLRFWKISPATIQAIEDKGTIQETVTLYADESGVVTQKRVAVGDYIQRGQPLFDLLNLSRVWVLFNAYEEDLARISVGDPIEFTTPALPNKTFQTRITFIDPIIDPMTRVASLRTEVSNTNGTLKPEMLVYGQLQKEATGTAQLTVPKSAVLWTGTRSVVYVKVPDTTIPSFQYREVELGDGTGDNYRLLSGLEAGAEVVTKGNFVIDAAAQLNNQPSMMNQSIAVKGSIMQEVGPDYTAQTPAAFRQQLTDLALAYIPLKNALVGTDAAAAGAAAKELLPSLARIDEQRIEGEARQYWQQQRNALQDHITLIAESADIEKQRKQFEFLSMALIHALEAFGTSSEALYVQHCPMAANNQGADWLALEKEIRNPYFGDAMLTCGTVRETLLKHKTKLPD